MKVVWKSGCAFRLEDVPDEERHVQRVLPGPNDEVASTIANVEPGRKPD